MRKMLWLPLGSILGLVILAVVAYAVNAAIFITPQSPIPSTKSSQALSGKMGDSLITPEGVNITLVAIEQHGGQMLFHLKVHNTQKLVMRVWNVDVDHGFALYNKVTQSFVITTAELAQADLATHPVLSTMLDGQTDADGWIAFAAESPSSYASTLYYRYRTVHTMRCPNAGTTGTPIDRSQCQPTDLYSTVHWDF